MTFLNPNLTRLATTLADYQGEPFLPNVAMNALNRLDNAITLDDIIKGKGADASVLIVITNEPCPKVLLTRRSGRLNAHAGEVSFVGGKKDDDETPVQTALREACEEVGLNPTSVEMIGKLPMQLSKSNLLVQPFVAVISPNIAKALVPNPDEIARLFWVELEYFLNHLPVNYRFVIDQQHKTHSQAFATQHHITAIRHLDTPAWVVDNEVIWGMTGRILANLLHIGFGVKVDWYYQVKPLAK